MIIGVKFKLFHQLFITNIHASHEARELPFDFEAVFTIYVGDIDSQGVAIWCMTAKRLCKADASIQMSSPI